jgi:hypothetical protein
MSVLPRSLRNALHLILISLIVIPAAGMLPGPSIAHASGPVFSGMDARSGSYSVALPEGVIGPMITVQSATSDWTAEGDQADALLGVSVRTAGDVNGDGYDDVIVGAPYYDGDSDINGGRALVFHGSAAGLAASADWIVTGNQSYAQFGWSVGAAGDVNGDGYDDVIIGAPYYDNGQTNEGAAFIYHGSASGLSTTAGWIAESDQADAHLGHSVGAAGDVNGDGYDDVILGAPYYDDGQTDEGGAFVYHGSAAGVAGAFTWSAASDQADARLGESVGTAGDVNGDGYDDVIAGAPYYDNGQTNEGRAYLFLGSAAGLSSTAGWTAESNNDVARLGQSVGTAGDVNGDGYDDVIVGAPDYDNGQLYEGAAFVYHGLAAGLSATASWLAEGNQAYARFGFSVSSAGDGNGDGYADVIIGAPDYSNGQDREGAVLIHHGSATGLLAAASWTAESDQAEANLGISTGTAGDVNGDGFDDVIAGAPYYDGGLADEGVAFVYHQVSNRHSIAISTAGDVNGDGYDDVIVGAPYYDDGQSDEGGAFVFYGSVTGLATSAGWIVTGNQSYAQFGWSVGAAGDVNGDGYADVIIGAPGYGNGQANEGAAFIYLGSASGLSAVAGWIAEGDQAGASFGYSVGTAGDVNGDGYADVIAGAPDYDNGEAGEGAAFIYHGSATGLLTSAGWIAEGDQANASFGYSVSAAGDVNGDGYADVIAGAPHYDNGQTDEGRAFVYLGSASGLSAVAGWIAESEQAGASFGYSVGTAGDVNGDGYADVIAGAPHYDNGQTDEGRAFVYHGSASGLPAMAEWTAESEQAGAGLGYSVSTAGDVNGDGYADVVAGAPDYDDGQADEGRIHIYRGSMTGLSAVADSTVEGDQIGAHFGASVGASNLDGDGFADAIAGVAYYDNNLASQGRIFVYPGVASGLSAVTSWTIESNKQYAQFGYSVSTAGDVNGDGYADVIVGAPYYSNGESGEGRAHLYYGSTAGLSTTAGWTAEGNQAGANFGWSVGTAGDVNGDGYADVIVGAPSYDNGQADEGAALIYYGSPAGLSMTSDWLVESDQAGAKFGYAVGSAGDVNGDGYADVIVGAPFLDNGQADEGRAYLYRGSAAGPSMTADWTQESEQASAYFGWSVGAAGDVNGDGYSDVIVGARYYDNGATDEGGVFLYHGSAAGLSVTANWTGKGNQANAVFGQSVGSAGDVNGDGYDDIIVGAPDYDSGETNEGRAFVYHGSASGLGAPGTPVNADWSAQSNVRYGYFGGPVGTAGDVNGDGYDEVVIGTYSYSNPESAEGAAFVYFGSNSGLGPSGTPTNADWMAEGDLANAHFGSSAGGAGDVNGDGYGDIVVGARQYSNGETNEGQARVYYGNAPGGLAVIPQQRRADDSAPVAFGGQSVSPSEVRLSALARTPFGRTQVRLEWEVKPADTPFDGTGLGLGAWHDSGTTGNALNDLVSGLATDTRYHWRLRIAGRPADAAADSAVTYRSRWLPGSTFFTALSGQQAIGSTGRTQLLGQAGYVDVVTLGTLSEITVLGYPDAAHDYEGLNLLGLPVLDRYFSITANDGASDFELTLCLAYADDEVAAAGISEEDLVLCRWTPEFAWSCLARSASSDTDTNLACADGLTRFSDWVVSAACTTAPAVAPDVTATASGDDVILTWLADEANAQYQVWISTAPDLDPEQPGDITPVFTGELIYVDHGSAASAGNHFYVVRALNACGAASDSSDRTGEFTFGLTPGD